VAAMNRRQANYIKNMSHLVVEMPISQCHLQWKNALPYAVEKCYKSKAIIIPRYS